MNPNEVTTDNILEVLNPKPKDDIFPKEEIIQFFFKDHKITQYGLSKGLGLCPATLSYWFSPNQNRHIPLKHQKQLLELKKKIEVWELTNGRQFGS